jgi:hypothetical protein
MTVNPNLHKVGFQEFTYDVVGGQSLFYFRQRRRKLLAMTTIHQSIELTTWANRGVEATNAVRPQGTPRGASISRLLLMKDVEIAEVERC